MRNKERLIYVDKEGNYGDALGMVILDTTEFDKNFGKQIKAAAKEGQVRRMLRNALKSRKNWGTALSIKQTTTITTEDNLRRSEILWWNDRMSAPLVGVPETDVEIIKHCGADEDN